MTHELNLARMGPHDLLRMGPRDGPPVVLIHGAWHGAWCWEGNYLDAFAEAGFDTLAPDLRGHGQSPAVKPMRWNRIADYADDVARVIAGLGSPPIVIGHSMGGFITQHLMARGVAMRGAGLLASVPSGGVFPVALNVLRRTPLTFLRMNLTMSLWPMVADRDAAIALFLDPDTDAQTAAAFHARLTDESFLGFLDMLALALPRKPECAPPVCVVGGQGDKIFAPAAQEKLAARFGTRAHILPDAPHDLMLGRNWRDSADIFLNWARDLPG